MNTPLWLWTGPPLAAGAVAGAIWVVASKRAAPYWLAITMSVGCAFGAVGWITWLAGWTGGLVFVILAVNVIVLAPMMWGWRCLQAEFGAPSLWPRGPDAMGHTEQAHRPDAPEVDVDSTG